MAGNLLDDKMYPANHKTVFVLDHTPYFGVSCGQDLELLKGIAKYYVPPIAKSLWTLSLECALEYCRIVWDLFPREKLVRFYVSDTVAHILNSWSQSQQTSKHILHGCAHIGMPPLEPPLYSTDPRPDYTVLHGLKAAIQGICEPTETQSKIKSDGGTILNRCTVICITSARDEESMNRLEEIFLAELKQQNKLLVGNKSLLPINHCHLIVINTFPVFIQSSVINHPAKILSKSLTTEVHSLKATKIQEKLTALVLQHYDLVSTTVTGIPMKAEYYDSRMVNDVEIFHAKAAHGALFKGDPFDTAAVESVKEGFDYETVTLHWCNPKGLSQKTLQDCTNVHRITFADVKCQASKCLVKFLFDAQSVALEMPRKSAGKIISHLLIAHGEDIFIHTLRTDRSVLEDLPSVTTGLGGKVGDYRMEDFRMMIRENTLVPIKGDNRFTIFKPLEKVKERLNRQTTFWPLTHSSTMILNLKEHIGPLPELIVKQTLTEDELVTCRKVIFNLIDLESKKVPLNPDNHKQIIRGQTIEEQYMAMWKELEIMLKCNLHSESHKLMYECLPRCYKIGDLDEIFDTDNPMSSPTNKNKSFYETGEMKVKAERKAYNPFDKDELNWPADRPTSAAPLSQRCKNVYEMLVQREELKIGNRPELAGRKRNFKLYANPMTRQLEEPGNKQLQGVNTKGPDEPKTEKSDKK